MIEWESEVTLRKDCNCACHTAPHAVIHVHPYCGPGSEGWPHVVLSNEDPYKALSLFGNDKETKLADTVLSATNTVHIRGDGKVIQIEVFGYERPDAVDEDDANWLRARCSVTVAEFSAVLRVSLVTHDFVRFADELEQAVQLLKGTATFSTCRGRICS